MPEGFGDGAIALGKGGTCSFAVRAANAQQAGFVGLAFEAKTSSGGVKPGPSDRETYLPIPTVIVKVKDLGKTPKMMNISLQVALQTFLHAL